MGFLDHTTNNIIVDAVLTDKGREKLAQSGAGGGLNIVKYAFADNEVDYTLLKKYGETVGKEKIEKNTPVFEANTDSTASYNTLIDYVVGSVPTIVINEDSPGGAANGFTLLTDGAGLNNGNFTVYFRLSGFPSSQSVVVRYYFNSNAVGPSTGTAYNAGIGNGSSQIKYCDVSVGIGSDGKATTTKTFNKITDATFVGTRQAYITAEVEGYGSAATLQVPVEFTAS